MPNRTYTIAGAVAAAVGVVVLSTGIFLSPYVHLTQISVVVLLLSSAGAMQVVMRLRNDMALGASLAFVFFLPYTAVGNAEVRASTIVPAFLLIVATVVGRALGPRRAMLREPLVVWVTAYIVVVYSSTLLNARDLTPESTRFLGAWTLAQVFFLAYAFYRPRATLEQQLNIAAQYFDALVLAAVLAVALGAIEYVRPEAVQAFFAPQARVGQWGERGALAGWIIPLRRIGSMIGSPNAFGALLTTGALVLLGRQTRLKAPKGALVVLLGLGVVALSTSRGATVGLLSGLAVYALTSKRRAWAFPLLAVALAVGALMPASVEFIGRGYVPAHAEWGRSVPAAAERLYLWQRALAGGSDLRSWLIGAGPLNAPFVSRTALRGAHNLFVTNFVFFGLAGLMCVSALCGAVLQVIRDLYKDRRTRSLARVSLAVFIALLVHSLVDDMLFYNTSVMLAVGPLLAMLTRAHHRLAHESKQIAQGMVSSVSGGEATT